MGKCRGFCTREGPTGGPGQFQVRPSRQLKSQVSHGNKSWWHFCYSVTWLLTSYRKASECWRTWSYIGLLQFTANPPYSLKDQFTFPGFSSFFICALLEVMLKGQASCGFVSNCTIKSRRKFTLWKCDLLFHVTPLFSPPPFFFICL